ncbi:MAG: hypothetical protein HWD59_07475 [Coxiellaceae bacterium]|nr:MAG: hypothetical protein HWD59_07475 [Coxiellaceae bacterium]
MANYNGEDEYYSRIFDLVADSKLSTSYYQKRFDYLCQNKNWEILAQPLWLRRFTLYPTLVHAVSHNDNTQPSANSLLGYIRPLIFSQFPGDQRSIFNQHFYLLLDKYGSEADKAQYGLLTDKRTFEIIDKMIKSQHDIVKNFKNESQEMRDGLDQATRSAKLIIDKVLQQSWPFPMTQRGYEELNKVISRLLKSSWFPISHLIVQVWANKAQQYDYNRIWLQKLLDGKIIGHHFDDYPHAKYLSELFPYDDQKAVDEIVEMIETFLK